MIDNKRVLVIGYGNIDRQDDGVAWHVLQQLSNHLDEPVLSALADLVGNTKPVNLIFQLQLTPEIVECFKDYSNIIFIDAQVKHDISIGSNNSAQDTGVQVTNVGASFQGSPLTHHLTPQSCMALFESLYKSYVEGTLVTIEGYEFGFSQSLSVRTSQSTRIAVGAILELLNKIVREYILPDSEVYQWSN